MLALNSAGQAIDNSGNATVSAPTCVLYSDSAAANSAAAGGTSAITAKAIAGVGGIASSNNWNVQSYMPYSPSLPDPFAPPSSTAVTPDPSDMKCAGHYESHGGGQNMVTTWVDDDLTDGTNMANATWLDTSGGTPVVRTGANCWKSLSVGSNRSLTVPANFGPLYVNGGNVQLQGAFTCNGCSIVMTNKDTSSTAPIGTWSSNAQATNNITAPTSGTYRGIAVYQDRRATGGTDQINGGSGNVISGIVYFPKDTLWLNGTGEAVSLCSMFVANNLKFNGGGDIAISSAADAACFGVGLPNTVSTSIVRLIA
jgi:hypothetical protein